MARKIKRFFVFLFFSLFFSMLSGKVSSPLQNGKKQPKVSADALSVQPDNGWNSANAYWVCGSV